MQTLVDKISAIKIDLSEDKLLNILKIRKRWPFVDNKGTRHINMINNIDGRSTTFFHDIDGYLNFEKFYYWYDKGYTFILIDILDLVPEFNIIKKLLWDHFGHQPFGNIYFTKGQQKISFDEHSDEYDIFVKNIYGTSEWKINNQTFKMENQNCIFLKEGVKHQVISVPEKRLSLTIGLQKEQFK